MAYELLKLIVDSEHQAAADQRIDALISQQDATGAKVQELSGAVTVLLKHHEREAIMQVGLCLVLVAVALVAGIAYYRDHRHVMRRMERLERQLSGTDRGTRILSES